MIIDCFTFFDELDFLEIRLNELKDIVDMFVLVESPFTFTGIPKPMYYRENRDRFKRFPVTGLEYIPDKKLEPMQFEKEQKQFGLNFVFDMVSKKNRIVIQGDCDEIPRASVVKKAMEEDWEFARFTMTLFYYWMNCRCTSQKMFKNSVLSRARRYTYNVKQNRRVDKTYYDAGWHFSHMGDIKNKLKSWGHADKYDKPPFNTDEYISGCVKNGIDLFGRRGKQRLNFEFIPGTDHLPDYITSNIDKFDRYLHE